MESALRHQKLGRVSQTPISWCQVDTQPYLSLMCASSRSTVFCRAAAFGKLQIVMELIGIGYRLCLAGPTIVSLLDCLWLAWLMHRFP
jgi:hypothetical protein